MSKHHSYSSDFVSHQIIGREGETAIFFSRCLLNSELREFGFAPRQLNRWADANQETLRAATPISGRHTRPQGEGGTKLYSDANRRRAEIPSRCDRRQSDWARFPIREPLSATMTKK